MTDIEMTWWCALAMEICDRSDFSNDFYPAYWGESGRERFDPLINNAQAMALVKKFRLCIGQLSTGDCQVFIPDMKSVADSKDLNRAICECVAKMQLAKAKP